MKGNKRKTTIKLLSLILAMGMLFSTMPVNLAAADDGTASGELLTPAQPEDSPEIPEEPAHTRGPLGAGEGNETRSAGNLALTVDESYIVDGAYQLADVAGKAFTVSYGNSEDVTNVVLVVECFDYGAKIAVNGLPKAGENGIVSVTLLDDTHVALTLDDQKTEWKIGFAMDAAALTDAQAADLLENGVQDTYIAVTEYTLPAGASVADVLTAGTQINRAEYAARPKLADETITQSLSYDYALSALPELTDSMLRHRLSGASQYGYYPNTPIYNLIDPTHDTVIMGWQLPDVYHGGALMEITGVKLYSPSDKLKLAAVLGQLTGNEETLANRHSAGVECWWGGWTIGEEQRDSDGAFYLLTPPEGAAAGYDERKQDGGLICAFYPIWRLKDRSDPLPVDSDAADGLEYTELAAANTVITYKLPGGKTGDAEFAGAKLYTFPQQNRNVKIEYSNNRIKGSTEDKYPGRNVVAGLSYNACNYVNVYNSHYVAPQDGVKVDYLPAYTGTVTQTFDFPYEIQPTKLRLTNTAQRVLPGGTESEIESITYWTADRVKHEAPVSHSTTDVSYMNDPYIKSDRWCEETHPSEDGMGDYFFSDGVSADNRITRVEIKWNHLANDRRFGNSTAIYDLYTEKVFFDYNVAEQQEDGADIPEDGKDVRVIFTQKYDGTYAGGAQTPDNNVLWFKVVPPKTPLLAGMNVNRFLVQDQNRKRTAAYIGGTDEQVMGNVGFWIGTETDGKSEYLESVTNPVIELKTQVAKIGLTNTSSLTGVTDEQCLAMLTGAFTAMPRLAGWTFFYTTNNHGETVQTYLIEGNIPEEGRAEQIPLAEGDCFTSIKLEYNGDFNTAHEEGKEAERVFWLMTDVKLKPFAVNPFTGETVQTSEDFSLGGVRLGGTVQYGGKAALNMRSVSGKYQTLSDVSLDGHGIFLPTAFLWSTRKAEVTLNGSILGNTDSTVPGSTVTLTWDLDMPVAAKNPDRNVEVSRNESDYSHGPLFDFLSNSTLYAAPWENIREAVYVELTDKAFEPDLANTEFFGYPADEYPVEHEIVETNGKTFLKLQFAEGFVRGKWMTLNGTTYTDNASNKNLNYNNNHPDKDYPTNGWMTIEGSTFFSASALNASADVNTATKNAGGWLKLSLKAKSSAAPGAHHPVGDLYVDVSELLAKYHASIANNESGTYYAFTGAVEDEYGLSDTAATGEKLFKVSGRNADGSSNYTVQVLDASASGDKYNITARKVWNDSDNAADTRPASVTVQLWTNGVLSDEVALTAEDGWTCTWYNLPKQMNDGTAITYEVREVVPEGYRSEITGSVEQGFTITNTLASMELAVEGYEGVYDGRAHSGTVALTLNGEPLTENVTYEYCALQEDGGWSDWSATAPQVTDVTDSGTFRVKAVHAVYGESEPKIYSLTVTPAALEITTESAERKYNGNPLTAPGTITGFVTVDGVTETAIFTVTGSQTQIGSSQNTYELVWDGTAKAGNYTIVETIGQLTVTAQEITIMITGHTDTKPYNGENQSVSGYDASSNSALLDVSKISFTGTDTAAGTNVDTYEMGLTAAQFSYDDPNLTVTFQVTDGWLKIEQLPVTVTVIGHTGTEPYNGENQTVSGYDASADSDLLDVTRISFTGTDTASGTNVGTYEMGLAAEQFRYDDPNLTVTFQVTDGWLKIEQLPVTVTVIGHTGTEPYNGENQTVSGYDASANSDLLNVTKISFTGTDTASGTNVGTYEMGLAAEQFGYDDPNLTVTFQVTDGWLKIEQLPVTVTVIGHTGETIYNGLEQTVEGFEASANSDLLDVTRISFTGTDTASGTNVGTYEMGLTAEQFGYDDPNLTVTFQVTDGWLKIEQLPVTVTITGHTGETIYNGQEQTVEGFEASADSELFDIQTVTYSGEPARGRDVATYPMNLDESKFSCSDGNFAVTFRVMEDGQLTITPATLTIITESAERKYNGNPLTAPGTITGFVTVDGVTETATFTVTGSQTKIGSSQNTYELVWDGTAKAGNYIIVETLGKLTVIARFEDPSNPVPDPTPVPGDLNGDDHFAYIVGYPDGTVQPGQNITRAEVATIFFRLLREEVRKENFTKRNSFSDVKDGAWFNNAVSTMAKLGVVNGYPDGTFRPYETITRAEFAAIAARFDEKAGAKPADFSDIAGHWASVEIAKAAANGWINGYPDGSFKPDQKITRAESMALINRVLRRDPAQPEDLLPDMTIWPDNLDTNKWYYLDVQEATNSHEYERQTRITEVWTAIRPDPDWTAYEK